MRRAAAAPGVNRHQSAGGGCPRAHSPGLARRQHRAACPRAHSPGPPRRRHRAAWPSDYQGGNQDGCPSDCQGGSRNDCPSDYRGCPSDYPGGPGLVLPCRGALRGACRNAVDPVGRLPAHRFAGRARNEGSRPRGRNRRLGSFRRGAAAPPVARLHAGKGRRVCRRPLPVQSGGKPVEGNTDCS